jgi:hypothetical protein
VAPTRLVRRYPFEPIELQPGLVLRLLTREEMWPLVAIVRETGLHGDDQAAVQRRVYGWWDDPACWPLGVFWGDEVKQYECYYLRTGGMDGDLPVQAGRARHALAGFMTHVDRARPRWFYRECARVTFERLFALGVRRLTAFPRADRPDWIAHLKATYGAVEPRPGRRVGRTAIIEYDLATARRAFTGWPARRTAPPVTRGRLTVSACGVDEALALLPALWVGYSPERAMLAERLLHERYWLDCGTLAVGTEDGVPKALWVTRDNYLGGPVCAHTTLSPWAAAPRLLHKLILEWELALGYTTASAVWEAWMWDLPRSRALVPWRERRRSRGRDGWTYVSTELTLADAVAIPDASWA